MGKAAESLSLVALGIIAAALVASGAAPALVGAVGAVALCGAFALYGLPIEKLAFVAVCVFVVTIGWNGVRIAGGALANPFMAAAFAVVAVLVVVERRPVPFPPWLFAAAAALLLSTLLVMVDPPSAELINRSQILDIRIAESAGPINQVVGDPSNLKPLVEFELSLALIPMMIACVATSWARCIRLFDLFVVSAVVSAAVATADIAGLHIAPTDLIGGRSSGLTLHPNYLALNLALALPLAMIWLTRSGRWRPAGAISVALLFVGIYASGSRAGVVGMVIGVVVTIAVVPGLRRGIPLVLPLAGMVMLPLLLTTNVGPDILDQVRLGDDSSFDTAGSDSQRDQAHELAVDQFRAEPLHGAGFAFLIRAHNIYLELLATGGLIAMVGFLIYLSGLADCVRKAWDSPVRTEATACGIAIIVWLANGVYDNQVADKYLYVIPGILVGFATVAQRARRVAADETSAVPSPGAVLGHGPIRRTAAPDRSLHVDNRFFIWEHDRAGPREFRPSEALGRPEAPGHRYFFRVLESSTD